jgi:hypothetical protein
MTNPSQPEGKVDRHSRPFTEFLLKQQRGKTHAELSDALDQAVQAVQATGKAATLVYKVTIKPLNKGQTETLTISDQIAVKLPQSERPDSVFFVDDDGHLTTSDPRQLSLELHEVPAAPRDVAELKDAK